MMEDPGRYGPRRKKRYTLASYPATVLVVAGIFTGKAVLFGLIGLVLQKSMQGFVQRAEEYSARTTDAMTAIYNESLEMAAFLRKGMNICYTISLVLVSLTVIFTIWARIWSERQKRARRRRRAKKAATAASLNTTANEGGAQQVSEDKAAKLSPIISESPAPSEETFVTPSEVSPQPEVGSSASSDAVSAVATTPPREQTPPAAGRTTPTPEGAPPGPEVQEQEPPPPEEGTSPTARDAPPPAAEVPLTAEEAPPPKDTSPPGIDSQPPLPPPSSEGTPSAAAGAQPTEEAPPPAATVAPPDVRVTSDDGTTEEVSQSTQQREAEPAPGPDGWATDDKLPDNHVRRPSRFPDIHEK